MILLNPDYLLFMLIPTLILFALILTQKSNITSVFDKMIVEKLTFDSGSLGTMGRNLILFFSLVLMIFALARPAIEKGNIKIESKKIDLLVALDISKSMMASDIYPNRLTFAKNKIYELIDSFEEANMGVIAFSSGGFLVSPMTKDSTTLKYLINNLTLGSISTNGTDLMIPIQKAATFLEKSKQKIVIIFTDGGDNEEFSKEIQKAIDEDVHVYVYATATNGGSPILNKDGSKIKDNEGNIVITKLNSTIKELSIQSGGAYIVGGLKDDSVALLVKDIKKKFEMQKEDAKDIKDYKELFYYPLGLALFLMLMAFGSFPRKSSIAIILALIFPSQDLKADMFDFQTINRANKAYKEEKYKKAADAYRELTLSKKSAGSFYDLANSLYKDEQYKSALKLYEKIDAKDKNLEYKKEFNSANSHFKLKKYEDALKSYEKAQKIKNEDDLEHNIELTKKMIKKEQDKKKQKKQNDKKQEQDDKKSQDDEKQNQKDKDKKNKKDKKDDKKKKKKKESKKSEQSEKKQEEKISEKEAKKWAERLEKMKPKTMPMQFQSSEINRRKNEKPW